MNLKLAIKNLFLAIIILIAAGLSMLQGDSVFGDVPTMVVYGVIAIGIIMAFIFWRVTAKVDKINAENASKAAKAPNKNLKSVKKNPTK